MTSKASEPLAPTQCIQHERFTEEKHGYQLLDLSLDSSGNIAVSGYHGSSRQTYIDLFNGCNCNFGEKFKLFHSEKFENYSNYWYRCVSFLDKNGSDLVTTIGDKIEIIDTKIKGKVLRSCKVDGDIRSLAAGEREVFTGFRGSQTVLVFDNDLKEMKQIRITGIQDFVYPWDLQVTKDKLFVCTGTGETAMSLQYDGTTVSEYKNTTGLYGNPRSVAVSAELGLLSVVFSKRFSVYCLNENEPILVFDVDYDITRIRISSRDKTLITGSEETGEIKIYDLEQLFSFEAMKKTLAHLVSFGACEELIKHFKVSAEEMKKLDANLKYTDKRMECFLAIFEEKINPSGAVSTVSDEWHSSSLKKDLEVNLLQSKKMKIMIALMKTRQKMWEDERYQLSSKLKTAESRVKELQETIKPLETISNDLKMTKRELQKAKEDRDKNRAELQQNQLKLAKETEALKEVLNKAKEDIVEPQKRSEEDKSLVDSETTIGDEGEAVLAAEFGRLNVAIAEQLTLDDCIKLAKICNIPEAECDLMNRISLVQIPGMKFLEVLKKRKVISMFDVSNLQKALQMLRLDRVNRDVISPYQERIANKQREGKKIKQMFTSEDVEAFLNASGDPSENNQRRETGGQLVEAREENRELPLSDEHHDEFYAEHSTGREGGTVLISDVILRIPPDALHECHVIALSVINVSSLPLDGEVNTARITPIIKLEPLGLMFKTAAQLVIPHSARISNQEDHDVIIYSGQITNSDVHLLDCIQWTEERFIPKKLGAKSVTVDIQRLTYISAYLESKTTSPPLHIVRTVPFVHGIRNTDDDITLTLCFCSDNDSQYNMLLSDNKTKILMEQYSTLQLHRHLERDGDDSGYLSMTFESGNDTYVPDTEQAVERIAVSHLCTASRVSHQLKLKKNQDTDYDVLHILLTFSQAQYEATQISMKARIKDLIISEESEKFLSGPIASGNKRYKDMLVTISSSLSGEQCKRLATCFQLTSEDTEMISSDEDPGKMLIKTLEEKSLIDPHKMIHFFKGLKDCHLDDIAKLVSEHINNIPKINTEENRLSKKDRKFEDILRYLLPVFVDGVLQVKMGVFTFPKVFKD